jgi:chromosomal replication initiator protein
MESKLNEILSEAKDLLKGEISELSYKTWILPLELGKIENNNVLLISDDPFKRDSVESRFKDLLENAFSIVLQKQCNVSIILKNSNDTQEKNTNFSNINYSKTYLNPNYSFDTFVVGDNNRFAHAAALAVAESPATAYNPLFIYGGVGLGKTHLLHAIGNEVLRNNKDFKILYVTSEKFTNDFINSLKDNNMDNFRNRYRNIDVLLIDDIQFIAGKDRLQEEFFHTFNTLRESGKQIVLSSDKPPRDIPLLEDRLKSRFEWGILADVAMADYEVRLAILRKKADEKHAIIDDDILKNIAAKIDSNIRELEGVFNKIVAQASLTHTPVTFEMAEKAINDIIRQNSSVISIEYIQEVICNYFDVTMKDLTSSQRSNNITFPRQIGMYLCRILTNESFPKVGAAFGKRDHTTVMHAFKKIEKGIKEDQNTKLIVESVKKIVLNNKQA